MEPFEKYYRDNSTDLDHLEPDPESWAWLEERLDRRRLSSRLPRWITAAAMLVIAAGLVISLVKPSILNPAPNANPKVAAVALEVGMPFPELSLRNPEGKLVPLSSLRGKVVLVEFWASWSTICTEEHCYYFQPLYDQYRDSGFEIYAVSVDSSAAGWLSGIERDALPWINVANFGGIPQEFPQNLPVKELPTTYLLDREGHILAKDVEAADLGGVLEKVM
jgi:thiol-disulfide isomerase/thioredoxin